jgi:prolyl-tRNA editing enzyme YbaK/EbsC (Cys-tRNA(Pro) deacylase)
LAAAFVVDVAVLVVCVGTFIAAARAVVVAVEVVFETLVVAVAGTLALRLTTGTSALGWKNCQDAIKRRARKRVKASAMPIFFCIHLCYHF